MLAILAFCLSLLGTFLVRSGILVSVHAFAVDPERGVWLLIYLAFVMGGAWVLFIARARHLHAPIRLTPNSRPSWMLLANFLLVLVLAIVLLGTLYPLVAESIFDQRLSVGPPYFQQTLWPISLLLLVLMGMVWPVSGWHGLGMSELNWGQCRGDGLCKSSNALVAQPFSCFMACIYGVRMADCSHVHL